MCTTEQVENVEQVREFERVTCSRCGGSGRYSYCQTMNGPYGPYTCFKCTGKGQMLTKRGGVAFQLFERSLELRADQLVPGMKVYDRFFGKWAEVKEVVGWSYEGGYGIVTYEGQEYAIPSFVIKTTRATIHVTAKTSFRVAHSAEEKRVKREAALDYQDTLTKAGTPRRK